MSKVGFYYIFNIEVWEISLSDTYLQTTYYTKPFIWIIPFQRIDKKISISCPMNIIINLPMFNQEHLHTDGFYSQGDFI